MALQKSPEEKDIKAVLEQDKDIDPILEDVLRKQFTDTKSGKLITSAGYMDSVEKNNEFDKVTKCWCKNLHLVF